MRRLDTVALVEDVPALNSSGNQRRMSTPIRLSISNTPNVDRYKRRLSVVVVVSLQGWVPSQPCSTDYHNSMIIYNPIASGYPCPPLFL